jgi:hypothetical protein
MTSTFSLTRALILVMAAAAPAVLAGCISNTQMNGAWADPSARSRAPANNVLVIGINRDSTARRIFEDAIVMQFSARGIRAQPSYNLLPEFGAGPPPDIQAMLQTAGVDSVLVSRTVRERTDIRVTPGHSYGPAGFYGMWGGAYSTAPNVYTVQKVEVESRLYDAKGLTLLWSGSSTTTPTSSMQKTITEFASVLVQALADARMIV